MWFYSEVMGRTDKARDTGREGTEHLPAQGLGRSEAILMLPRITTLSHPRVDTEAGRNWQLAHSYITSE